MSKRPADFNVFVNDLSVSGGYNVATVIDTGVEIRTVKVGDRVIIEKNKYKPLHDNGSDFYSVMEVHIAGLL